MSLTLNMVGGGDPDKTGIILNNSQVKPKINYAFVSIGAAALSESPFNGVMLAGKSNGVQYSYIRLGPVDLTNVTSILSEIMAVTGKPSSPGSTTASKRAVLFVSQSDDDRSYNGTATTEVVTHSTASDPRSSVTLDTSSLSGQYYIYAGTDSGGASWSAQRSAIVYGVKLNKGA